MLFLKKGKINILKYTASIISSLHTPSNQNVSPSFMLHINWGSIGAGEPQSRQYKTPHRNDNACWKDFMFW